MSHLFKVGDRVSLAFGFHDQNAAGTYAITRLLPTRMNGEPQYRIKGSDDRERVIGEGQVIVPGKAGSFGRRNNTHNPITNALNHIASKKRNVTD